MVRKVFLNVLIACFCSYSIQAQDTSLPLEGNIALQCSAIREVIYSAYEKQFSNLIEKEGRGSRGYQTMGSWKFETVQYESKIQWKGASRTYIDNSEESTDSSRKLIRQFVAEFGNLKSEQAAKELFFQLNQQIAECRLPLGDSDITILRPLPLDKIKGDLPVAAIDARLYPITIKNATEAEPGQEVVIMTAYEKAGRYYGAYMIVEYRVQQGEHSVFSAPLKRRFHSSNPATANISKTTN